MREGVDSCGKINIPMGAATRAVTASRAVTERIAFPRRLFRQDVIQGEVGGTMSKSVQNFDGLPHFNAAVNSVLIGLTGRLRSCSTSPERMKKVPSSKLVADGDVRDDYRAGSIYILLQSGEDQSFGASRPNCGDLSLIGAQIAARRRKPPCGALTTVGDTSNDYRTKENRSGGIRTRRADDWPNP